MKINKLQLVNFRNYDRCTVDFDRMVTVFYGNNGQGKTNILEAIYLCSTTKSHRGSKDGEIINFEND